MNINFYVKSIGSFIILSVMWYERLTKCYLLHTDPSSSGNCGRHAKQHAFLYQLWTTGALLNILLGSPNHDSQNSPIETHELGSLAKKWDDVLWDFPKIHDSVDVVWGTIEMKPCGVKNLSSTIVKNHCNLMDTLLITRNRSSVLTNSDVGEGGLMVKSIN